ncbi:MAG: phosphoribosylformylglycinamidine synthase subunit PurQ [Alphaproteobacteria bacterium]|nr:phosphoribosylformylglycinamidine synthase subunit PurQ [Alphaproteobacteria bacterium]
MRAGVIVFPGSNCDRDVAVALGRSMGRPPVMIWHGTSALPDLDLIVLPGGFAYGDYLRPGAIAAHAPIMPAVVAAAHAGVRVLGICNGFQILTEAGLLPGALLRNAGLRFVCRDIHLRVENSYTPFTQLYEDDEVIRIPVAHHDGNYFADNATLAALEDNDQVAFRYCEPGGEVSAAANPNGSLANIAGIFNRDKTILGLMPHPERLADPALGSEDGSRLFDSLVATLS